MILLHVHRARSAYAEAVDDLPPVTEEGETTVDNVGAASFTDDERARLMSRS